MNRGSHVLKLVRCRKASLSVVMMYNSRILLCEGEAIRLQIYMHTPLVLSH